MAEKTVTPPVRAAQAVCFVLPAGDQFIGCVSFQQQEFYSTACRTYQDAMSEAQKIGVMLYEEQVITECVGCQCIPPKSKNDRRP